MAKKKSTNQSKHTQENIKPEQHPNQSITTNKSSMDEQSEKLQSLKTLNLFLLKETHERRQQVEALAKSKMAIGAELEKVIVESIGLELEKGLLGVYMMSQMGDFGGELKKMEDLKRGTEKGENEIRILKKRVSELVDGIEKERGRSSCLTRERDDFQEKLGVMIAEANGLREKVLKMEENERKMVDEAKNQRLEIENEMGLLKKQKDLIEKELSESVQKCEDLKREFLKGKSVIEEERKREVTERSKLEKDVMTLNEIVSNLREAENGLKKEISELQMCNADMVASRHDFSMEFSMLKDKKMECEKKIKGLLEEKNMNRSSIEELQKELENKKKQIDEIVIEKNEISKESKKQVKKVNILEKIVTSLREAEKGLEKKISDLEKCNAEMAESQDRFSLEFSLLKDERVESEKKIEGLLEEKNMSISIIEELQKELENQKRQIDEMVSEKKEFLKECNMQVKKVKGLEKDLNESSEVVLSLQKVEDGLLKKVSELEKSCAEMVASRDRLLEEFIGLKKEKTEIEKNVDSLLGEKSLNLNRLQELEENLAYQARNNGKLVLEKNEIEEEKNLLVMKVRNLDNKVNDLNGDLLGLQEVEEGLNTKISELEMSNAEMVEKVNVLQEEKLESVKKIEKLLAENKLRVKSLCELEKKVEDQNRKVEGIVREKMGIEEEKANREIELQKELGQIKDVMLALQDKCKAHVEETNRLESEITKFRNEIAVVTNERDDAENCFEKEKKNVSGILLNVSEMEKKLEGCLKEMEIMNSAHEKVSQEKKALGKLVETLVPEIASLQKNLDSKCQNSKWVLTMLKNTAALVNKLKDENSDENGLMGDFLINEKRIERGEDVQPYMIEFEAIKDAFLSKESKVKEMNMQLVSMAKEANKKKSFWTLISSATTLLVAASIAYVARGH